MNLMPVVNHLAANGYGTPGKTLFLEQFPAQCNNGLLVRSRILGAQVHYDLPGYFKFRFQLISRSLGQVAAKNLIEGATKKLFMENTDLEDWKVNYIRPVFVPSSYPISLGEVIEYNCDFDACIVNPEWAFR